MTRRNEMYPQESRKNHYSKVSMISFYKNSISLKSIYRTIFENRASILLNFFFILSIIPNDINQLSFPQAERVGNPSFSERFRTSRNDKLTGTYVAVYNGEII
jgi:hypothetical protein